jgi:hypothetical protein
MANGTFTELAMNNSFLKAVDAFHRTDIITALHRDYPHE